MLKLNVVLSCKKNGVNYTAYQLKDGYLINVRTKNNTKWYEIHEFSAICMDLDITMDEAEEKVIPTFTPVPKEQDDDDELPF